MRRKPHYLAATYVSLQSRHAHYQIQFKWRPPQEVIADCHHSNGGGGGEEGRGGWADADLLLGPLHINLSTSLLPPWTDSSSSSSSSSSSGATPTAITRLPKQRRAEATKTSPTATPSPLVAGSAARNHFGSRALSPSQLVRTTLSSLTRQIEQQQVDVKLPEAMAIPMQRLGGNAFRHGNDDAVEREYDRLRDMARAEAEKRNSCFDRSQQAYKSGDGAGAKQFSNQGKAHDAKMDDFNRQASEYIFRENNAPGRIDEDEIDLHGQFVEEAERILEQRIRADQARGANHLFAIVGKGHHSAGGVQKLKPKVEELCRELGLRYNTDEENEGRININLQGGEPVAPGARPPKHHGGQQQHHGGHQGHQQQQHHGGYQGHQQQQQQHHGQQHQQDQGDELAQEVKRHLPRILRALEKHCCTVM